jgi:hypothetical protein
VSPAGGDREVFGRGDSIPVPAYLVAENTSTSLKPLSRFPIGFIVETPSRHATGCPGEVKLDTSQEFPESIDTPSFPELRSKYVSASIRFEGA